MKLLIKSNTVAGCIYRHTNIDVSDFNNQYLKELLDSLLNGNTTVFLLDFNVEFLHYDCDLATDDLLDSFFTIASLTLRKNFKL